MARHTAWVALAAVGLALVGCGPGKELPADVPAIEDVGEKKIDVPPASDKAAKEYLEKAVKPKLVANGKVGRVVFKGVMTLPTDGQKVPFQTTRTMAMVWPDRVAVGNELLSGVQKMSVNVWLKGSDISALSGPIEPPMPNRGEYARNTRADVTGQVWMALGLPLAEPKAIVFDFRSTRAVLAEGGQLQEVKQFRLALPDYPVYHLTFDAKTDLLVRVEYATVEAGVRRKQQWTALDHKAGPGGVMLPQKIELRHDNQVVEQWEVDKWEFPDTIADSEFSPSQPKK